MDDDEKEPPYLFEKKIEVKKEKKIARATLYASALGVYTFWINGNRVGDRYFAPGYTEYFYRVQYQEYPVTEMLKEMAGGFSLTAIGCLRASRRIRTGNQCNNTSQNCQ